MLHDAGDVANGTKWRHGAGLAAGGTAGGVIRRGLSGMGALLALSGLAACAASAPPVAGIPDAPAAAETIAISVGPCFGFCPVYEVAITPAGAVRFTGERHTAVLGSRERQADADIYRTLARELQPFRPAAGTEAHVPCTANVADTPSYRISWTTPDGRRTVATHQGGCPGGPGQALDAVLERMPARLGITDWTSQVTRPGVSRG